MVTSPATLVGSGRPGRHEHLCLAYDEYAQFRAAAHRFLLDGLVRGQQVRHVTARPAGDPGAELRAAHRGRPDAGEVVTLDADPERRFDPAERARAHTAATERALARGFTGLRVATDVTPLVHDAEWLAALARYEHLVDRYMVSSPFSALCGYARSRLGPDEVAQVACLHAGTSPGATPFRLYAAPGATAALAGEVDLAAAELLVTALDRADLPPVAGRLVLDVSGLTFLDHRGLYALAEHGRRVDATVVLRDPRPIVRRLVELVPVTGVQAESRR
jgi:anti-anti-sigma regulatory factor